MCARCRHLNREEIIIYIPYLEDAPDLIFGGSCRGRFESSSADDDINYSVLALELLEAHGRDLTIEDVARAWILRLPAGMTFTAERAAYRRLLVEGSEWFGFGNASPEFDLSRCSDNQYNDWIGAQIRADVYGWVAPGDPELAAALATTDASLSHRGDGVYGAVIVAAWGAAIGEVVATGCDTDCNGATVGALWALQGKPIPEHWTIPWGGRIAVSLAGTAELRIEDLVSRTVAVARSLAR